MARKKGSTRLVDVGYGTKRNKFDVRFTASEIKSYKNLVQKLNRRSASYKKQMEAIRQSSKNTADTRIPIEPLYDIKSTSLHKFQSRNEFQRHMSTLRRQGRQDYTERRFKVEIDNFKESIRKVFTKQDARALITKINKFTNKELHEAMIAKNLEHTGYVYYDPSKSKFNTIMNELLALRK